jgi:hypothetical protein
MAFVIADRVKEISTSTGSGTFTLSGAYTGFQTFLSAIGAGNTTFYCIANTTTGEWEIGKGTVLSGPARLQRDEVYKSSNANSLVNFSAGVHDVFVSPSAHKSITYPYNSFDLSLSGSLIVPGAVSASAFSGNGAGLTGIVSATASLAITASYALNAASSADWATIANKPTGIVSSSLQINTGSFSATGSFTGSFKGDGTNVLGVVTSSYASAVQFSGVNNKPVGLVSSSLQVNTGSFDATGSFTGSFKGDGSNVINVVTSSYAATVQFSGVNNKPVGLVSSSLQINTGIFVATGSFTGSFKGDGSQVTGVVSSSYAGTDWLAINNKPTGLVSSSLQINTGSFAASGSFTGSFKGDGTNILGIVSSSYAVTASYSMNGGGSGVSSSYATTSSYATIAQNVLGSITSASYALTSSYTQGLIASASTAQNAISSSYAQTAVTASYFTGSIEFPNGLAVTGSVTASSFLGTLVGSASYAPTDWTAVNNKPVGLVSSSLQINTGSFSGGFTGSLLGSSSYATTAVTASYISGTIGFPNGLIVTGSVTASAYAGNLIGTASLASTASAFFGVAATASLSTTASYAVASERIFPRTYKHIVPSVVEKNFFMARPVITVSPGQIGGSVAQTWEDLIWADKLGLFVGVASDDPDVGGQRIVTSPDGINWTLRTPTPSQTGTQLKTVGYSPELGILVALQNNTGGTWAALTSSDGVTWDAATLNRSSWTDVCWAPELGKFVAVGGNQGKIATSQNGITWVTSSAPNLTNWQGVTWAPELALFVACGVPTASSPTIMTSPDGTTWTLQNGSTSTLGYTNICWSRELQRAVAVSGGGVSGSVLYSSDAITWLTGSAAGQFNKVLWAPELGIFIGAVTSPTNKFFTSADGISWTQFSMASGLGVASRGWSHAWSPQLRTVGWVSQNNGDFSTTFAYSNASTGLNTQGTNFRTSATIIATFSGSFSGSVFGTSSAAQSLTTPITTYTKVPTTAPTYGVGKPAVRLSYIGTSLTYAAMSASALWATPFEVGNAVKLDKLLIRTNTPTANSKAILGIYSSDATSFAPTTLLYSSSVLDISGQAAYSSSGVNLNLRPGQIYWSAITIVTASQAQIAQYTGDNYPNILQSIMGEDESNIGQTYGYLFKTGIIGSLPSTFPVSASRAGGTGAPLIWGIST